MDEGDVILDTYIYSSLIISRVIYKHRHTYTLSRLLCGHEEGDHATRDAGTSGGRRTERDEPDGKRHTVCSHVCAGPEHATLREAEQRGGTRGGEA